MAKYKDLIGGLTIQTNIYLPRTRMSKNAGDRADFWWAIFGRVTCSPTKTIIPFYSLKISQETENN